MDGSELFDEMLMLTMACQQGAASPEEYARLERLLTDNPEAILCYLRIVKDTVALRDVAAQQDGAGQRAMGEVVQRAMDSSQRVTATTSRSKFPRSSYRFLAIAAIASSILACVGAVWFRAGSSDSPATRNGLAQSEWARIIDMANVNWAEGAKQYSEWSLVRPGETLKFASGRVNLFIANGAELLVEGPAELQFVSLSKVLAHQGKFAARVGPEAIGFCIETPHANVIDRGTSFGLSVDGEHGTSVAVYEGIVDFDVLGKEGHSRRRLNQGEALNVDQTGQLSRIETVDGTDFLEPPRVGASESPRNRIIASAGDNIQSLKTTKFYRVRPGGFGEDCQMYVDRMHEWNGLTRRGVPPFLVGGDYVMTYNDDKVLGEIEISVTLNQPATLYVLFDDRVPPPEWLKRDFVDTNWDVGADERDPEPDGRGGLPGAGRSVDSVFSIWKRTVRDASTVVLGPLTNEKVSLPPRKVESNMYGIVATPITQEFPAEPKNVP